MSDKQRDAITDAMKSFAGLKFSMMRHDATPDSAEYADKLRDALTNAGMVCTSDMSGTAFGHGGISPGVSASVGKDEMGALGALAGAMRTQGLLPNPLPVGTNNTSPDAFGITVAPNR
jgi:hypothetical protein